MKVENVVIRSRELWEATDKSNEKEMPNIYKKILKIECDGSIAYSEQFIDYVKGGDKFCDAGLPFVCAGMWLALRSLLKLCADDVLLTGKYKSIKQILKECVKIQVSKAESEDEDV